MLRVLRFKPAIEAVAGPIGSRQIARGRNYTTGAVDPVIAYESKVDRAKVDCLDKVKKYDPSSLLLSKFLPTYLESTYIGIRAFNTELSKVSNTPVGSSKAAFADVKFSFWRDQIDKCSRVNPLQPDLAGIKDPVSVLLADTFVKGINIDPEMLKQMVYTHQHFLKEEAVRGFANSDAICSYGEGINSQINYMMQSACLTPGLYGYSDFGVSILEEPHTEEIRNGLSDVSAHIGQATAICSFIIGLKYFAQRSGQVFLPQDVLAKNGLSQESTLRYLQGESDSETNEKLKNAIFTTTTTANDHILSARMKLEKIKADIAKIVQQSSDEYVKDAFKEVRNGLPDCLFVPFMSAIPTVLYLERLQKADFDVTSPKLQFKEYRLAWRAYWDYRGRKI